MDHQIASGWEDDDDDGDDDGDDNDDDNVDDDDDETLQGKMYGATLHYINTVSQSAPMQCFPRPHIYKCTQ